MQHVKESDLYCVLRLGLGDDTNLDIRCVCLKGGPHSIMTDVLKDSEWTNVL